MIKYEALKRTTPGMSIIGPNGSGESRIIIPIFFSVFEIEFGLIMSSSLSLVSAVDRLLATRALSWEVLVRESALDFASFVWLFNVIQ